MTTGSVIDPFLPLAQLLIRRGGEKKKGRRRGVEKSLFSRRARWYTAEARNNNSLHIIAQHMNQILVVVRLGRN